MTIARPARRTRLRLPHAQTTTLYVAAWVLLGATCGAVLLRFLTSEVRVSTSQIISLVAITALAEGVLLYLHHGKSKEFISLVEVAIAINVFLLAPREALWVTLAGVALANIAHRRHALKIVFNLGQYAVATSVAIAVFELLGGSHSVMTLPVAGALGAAMVAFGLVNALAMSGLVCLLEGRGFRAAMMEGSSISSLTVLGNTAVGILAAVVWQANPELTPLFIAPALTLHLAYRGVVRTSELLEAVTSERDRLQRIVRGSSNGIALLDADGHVDVWNPAMAVLTGVESDAAVGAPASQMMRGSDLDEAEFDVKDQIPRTTTPPSVFEMRLAHRAGGSKIVKVRRATLTGHDDEVTGHVLMVDDVTRERETERLKDDFLARVSHELRTPLTPIKGYAQVLRHKRDRMPADTQDQALDLIGRRVQHMEAVIDDLLLVGRIAAGRSGLGDQVQVREIDATGVTALVLEHFRDTEKDRDIILCAPEEAPATADPKRVGQILINLLSNACKYSAPDTPIEVDVCSEDGRVTITVSDHGRGIPPDHLGRVFDRFHRVEDPLTMQTGGMGLGLYISRSLAQAMDGDLEVESSLGQGSTFTLRLPTAA